MQGSCLDPSRILHMAVIDGFSICAAIYQFWQIILLFSLGVRKSSLIMQSLVWQISCATLRKLCLRFSEPEFMRWRKIDCRGICWDFGRIAKLRMASFGTITGCKFKPYQGSVSPFISRHLICSYVFESTIVYNRGYSLIFEILQWIDAETSCSVKFGVPLKEIYCSFLSYFEYRNCSSLRNQFHYVHPTMRKYRKFSSPKNSFIVSIQLWRHASTIRLRISSRKLKKERGVWVGVSSYFVHDLGNVLPPSWRHQLLQCV